MNRRGCTNGSHNPRVTRRLMGDLIGSRAHGLLARVRKLKLPAVQINAAAEGGRQVNVA